MDALKTTGLFVATAVCEILGCYLVYLWLRQGHNAWLLTLHPHAAGRVYAAYGGVYVTVALGWLWKVDGIPPTTTDLIGAALCLGGMAVIMVGASQNP